MTQLSAEFDAFSSELDIKKIVKEAVTEATRSMTQTVARVAANAACHAVFEASRENEELREKRLNVVVFGVEEDESTPEHDLEFAKNMASKVNIAGDNVSKAFRAGPVVRGKPRLMKVGFTNLEAKQAFLEGGRKNKFGTSVRVRRDLTFREREARRERAKSFYGNTEQVEPRVGVTVGENTGGGQGHVGGQGHGGDQAHSDAVGDNSNNPNQSTEFGSESPNL